jgi:hypothetical protein
MGWRRNSSAGALATAAGVGGETAGRRNRAVRSTNESRGLLVTRGWFRALPRGAPSGVRDQAAVSVVSRTGRRPRHDQFEQPGAGLHAAIRCG